MALALAGAGAGASRALATSVGAVYLEGDPVSEAQALAHGGASARP